MGKHQQQARVDKTASSKTVMVKTIFRRDLLCTVSACWLVVVLVVYFTLGPQLMARRVHTRPESRLGLWEDRGHLWRPGQTHNHPKREVLYTHGKEHTRGELRKVGEKDQFAIREPFSLPFPEESYSVQTILTRPWVQELKDFLKTISPPDQLVNVIIANYDYQDVVVNWLVSARIKTSPPLENILVVALDLPLNQFLKERGFASILLEPHTLLERIPETYAKFQIHRCGAAPARLTVLRFINHWGFDVANYDPDAIMLKNMRPLYDAMPDVDLFGGYGEWPIVFSARWGTALCVGSWMLRASPVMETFWEYLSVAYGGKTGDDQWKVCGALLTMNLTWTNSTHAQQPAPDTWWTATGMLKVHIFSTNVVCRLESCKKEDAWKYYVWHKGHRIGAGRTTASKRDAAEAGDAWLIRNDWEERSDGEEFRTLRGDLWLQVVALPQLTT